MLPIEPHHTGDTLGPPPERATLIEKVTAVKGAMEAFDLSERSFQSLWRALISLESFYKERTGERSDDAAAVYAARLGLAEPSGYTIGALLYTASQKALERITGHSTQDTATRLMNLGVLVTWTDRVFVETDFRPVTTNPGDGTWSERRTAPRLEELLVHLRTLGIHRDDVIIRVGSVRTEMVRTEPYVVVEIPGLTREVVVCNEVGEITFVAARRMGPDFYASRTKEALKATDGISTVVYHRREQWLTEVTDLLFSGAEFKRINVRDQEALRLAIVSMDGMSPETWAEMTYKQKRAFRVPGSEMGLDALATRFGIKGDPVNSHAIHLQLGEKIFGMDTVISERLRIERATPEELSTLIATSYTPETWAEMTYKQKLPFRVPGSEMGLNALATRFGIKGNPISSYAIHLELGEKIFGMGTILSEKLLVARGSKDVEALPLEDLGTLITKSHTPDTWAEMNATQKRAFRVPGGEMGLRALASRFGVKGNPVNYHTIHLELGEKIFGMDTVISERLRIERATPEELSTHITKSYTPDTWAEMNATQKRAFLVPGSEMGLKALATRFGVKGNPVGYHAIHLQLGEKIFGMDTVISERLRIERATPEELSAHITKSYTPDTWAEMNTTQKRAFRVPGSEMGLNALATRFGVKGDPVGSHAIHLELGDNIFGATQIQEHRKAQHRD